MQFQLSISWRKWRIVWLTEQSSNNIINKQRLENVYSQSEVQDSTSIYKQRSAKEKIQRIVLYL